MTPDDVAYRDHFRRFFARTRKWLSLRIYPEQMLTSDDLKPTSRAANRADQPREIAKARRTFETTSAEWLKFKIVDERKDAKTVARERHLIDVLNRHIGPRPMADLEPPDVLASIRPYMAAGQHETARRMRVTASRVFQYGVACGYCPRDVAADLKGALTAPQTKPRPALTEPNAVGDLMCRIDSYCMEDDCSRGRVVCRALQFLALTFVRPGEARSAEWSELDFQNSVWLIPAAKMKMRRPHEVPLSRQAIQLLSEVKKMTGERRYVFSLRTDKPLSNNTFNKALRALGYDTKKDHCAHGFKATASTLLNEERRDGEPVWHPDVIELQLAHVDQNSIRACYNRAKYWQERVRLMQHWADQLDKLRDGAFISWCIRRRAKRLGTLERRRASRGGPTAIKGLRRPQ